MPGFFRLLKFLRQQQIEMVVCGQNKDTKIAAVAAWMLGGVSVIARHGLQLISKKWKYKFIFTKMIQGVITNSASIKREYDGYGWFPKDFVKVIFNGYTAPEQVTAFDYRSQFDLSREAVVIVSTGRLAKQKGYEILIEAAEIARDQSENWVFFIAGKGKLEKKLKRQVKNGRLSGYVRFLGFIDDVGPYVKGSDLFVLPSFYEGMPNSVMEAMGLGKCCVVTAVNGNNELIRNDREGLLVQPGDAAALYEGIKKVADDPELAEKMGMNALKCLSETFSEEIMIDEVEAFLKSKIDG
ncbi:MAG: glycosyltransferase family 4 protein [Bacteroidales bacterium]|nr:glycosyltransferase family 4 protein [Bacteroidales bacterium]